MSIGIPIPITGIFILNWLIDKDTQSPLEFLQNCEANLPSLTMKSRSDMFQAPY